MQRLVYNWVRPHGGLGKNKTPAMLVIKATNSGFGLLLMSKPAKLLGFISAIAPNKEPKNFGIHCQVCTDRVLSLTRIFGGLTLLYSLHSVTRLLERSLVNYIERFNCTMRQRVSRLVRKTLSFSKKLENHIAAIWFFIHHYNSSLLV